MNGFWNVGIFILAYLILIWKAGKVYPILYLFLFVYFIQYVFSTYLIYNVFDTLKNYMVVKQELYFDFTIPALLSLSAGILLFNKDIDIRGLIKRIDPEQAARLGYLLIVISLVFQILPVAGFSSFTKYLKYSGAFCLLFANARIHYFAIGGIFVALLFESLTSSVFIDFFVISTYLFFFISLKYKFSFWLRFSFILVAAPVLILVQTVKKEYREATWAGDRQSGTQLFTELAEKNINKDKDKSLYESTGVVRTVGRLTQGWHLGLALKWVPQQEPFADGQEIISDVASSFLPRAIFKNKKVVGSQDKFLKYTGHVLHNQTSMTIGVLGDFYINFGVVGAFMALFIFGALLSKLVFYFLKRYVIPNPINIVWIPFILNYLMRANNDFYMVFNCLVKGFIIFLLVTYFEKKLWPRKKMTYSH